MHLVWNLSAVLLGSLWQLFEHFPTVPWPLGEADPKCLPLKLGSISSSPKKAAGVCLPRPVVLSQLQAAEMLKKGHKPE